MIVVGLVAMAVVIWGRRDDVPPAAIPEPVPEKPWLSRAAADHILGPYGSPGPLFTGVTLGGAAPSAEIREHIAAFARENDVSIDFEVADDELVAIRFDVTFGGCCGYEGVDALAARIGRPKHLGGCGGEQTFFYDNWSHANEDGTHVRGTVRVNRLSLRWERTVALDDVLARAERVLGTDRTEISTVANDRWLELETGKRYLLEMPYAFGKHDWQPARSRASERGMELVTDRRIVTAVTLTTPEDRARLKARWGKPRVSGDDLWVWHKQGRTIVASFEDPTTTITLSRR
jgi:hypothetical protein